MSVHPGERIAFGQRTADGQVPKPKPEPATTLKAILASLTFALLIALVMACGGGNQATATPRPTPTPTPSPSPSPTLAPLSVDGVLAAAKAIGLPIAEVTVFTADSDPDKLLGRPNQYTARAAWHDSRLSITGQRPPGTAVQDGGALELFASAQDLSARLKSLGAVAAAEYDYSSEKGPVLLRLSRQLTPEQAGQYVQALKLVLPDLVGSP